jgi:hypothetical protein
MRHEENAAPNRVSGELCCSVCQKAEVVKLQ